MSNVHYDSEQPQEVELVQKFFRASTRKERALALIDLLTYIRDSPDMEKANRALDNILRHMWLSEGKPGEAFEEYINKLKGKIAL